MNVIWNFEKHNGQKNCHQQELLFPIYDLRPQTLVVLSVFAGLKNCADPVPDGQQKSSRKQVQYEVSDTNMLIPKSDQRSHIE